MKWNLYRNKVKYLVLDTNLFVHSSLLPKSILWSRILQPLALGQLIIFYMPNQDTMNEQEAYLYAGAVILCSLLYVFVVHPYMMGVLHLGMKLRISCCTLIYRKALRLSKTALGQTTVGQLVNLLSNDVNRFDVAMIFAHQLWIGPLQTVIATYLMYLQIGVSAIFGVVALLLFIPLQCKRCFVIENCWTVNYFDDTHLCIDSFVIL